MQSAQEDVRRLCGKGVAWSGLYLGGRVESVLIR